MHVQKALVEITTITMGERMETKTFCKHNGNPKTCPACKATAELAIDGAFKGTNFGDVKTTEQRKRFVAQAVLKKMCDYEPGSTISHILQELGFTKTLHGKPTKAARRWMYDVIGRER